MRPKEAKITYVRLNTPTAYPPRAAVPVHPAWLWNSSLSPYISLSVKGMRPRQLCRHAMVSNHPVRHKAIGDSGDITKHCQTVGRLRFSAPAGLPRKLSWLLKHRRLPPRSSPDSGVSIAFHFTPLRNRSRFPTARCLLRFRSVPRH